MSGFRVVISCTGCGATTEAHVLGRWDLAGIDHDCDEAMSYTFRPGPMDIVTEHRPTPINVRFSPPRPTY